ncbi:hypothetical protein ACJJTC_010385 [Scirpophaga incertulas]
MVIKYFLLLILPMVTSALVTLSEEDFGTLNDEVIKKFTWKNFNGFSMSVITYGAHIQSIKVPDRNGIVADVVLGFDDLNSYVQRNSPYFGATIGRCANRIAGGMFEIDDQVYVLAKNDGNNHLHGGIIGFDKVIWKYHVEGLKVTLSYLSKDGEEGYPGDLVTNVSFEVLEDNTVRMVFQSSTTKKTVVNLTNHSYFNLAGHQTGAAEIYKHVVAVNANKITVTNSESIPTGAFMDVGGTQFDLRIPRQLGKLIENSTLFDNNFCVTTYDDQKLNFVSRVVHPVSGRTLEVFSDQPGVQLYTANHLPSSDQPPIVGKNSATYSRHGAFCLETQKFPDAVHHSNFPSVILKPGDLYVHNVHYRFSVDK